MTTAQGKNKLYQSLLRDHDIIWYYRISIIYVVFFSTQFHPPISYRIYLLFFFCFFFILLVENFHIRRSWCTTDLFSPFFFYLIGY